MVGFFLAVASLVGVTGLVPLGPRGTSQRRVTLAMAAEGDYNMKKTVSGVKDRMTKSIDSLNTNLQSIRTGRASPDILNRVVVDYYGAPTPLTQLATVSVSGGSQLLVSPFDKSSVQNIDAAINENDGDVIRLNIPALTEDRRKELAKEVKAVAEEAKIALRNIRRSANDEIKKAEKKKTIGEDEAKDGQDQVQKLTDAMVKQVDEVAAKKEKEIMKV